MPDCARHHGCPGIRRNSLTPLVGPPPGNPVNFRPSGLVDRVGHAHQTAALRCPAPSGFHHACCHPPRLDARGSPRPVRPSLPGIDVPCRLRAPRAFRPERGPGLDPAVGENRRLPRGLRLLPAGRALPHRCRSHEADEHRGGAGKGPRRQGRRRLTLLHGRRLAQPEGPRHPEGGRDDPRGEGLGLETCATLGMLKEQQAIDLRAAGLDYYNHNLDTAPDFYGEIIHTREYQDRLDTLEHVRDAGMKTCCGGIVGMGESRGQRAGLLQALANLPAHPDSVPINRLVQVEGTPLAGTALLDPFEFVRTIAVARLMMPAAMVRLSAGRAEMSEELQAMCFLAGANSIFYGEKLLTTGNPDVEADQALFARLGLRPMAIVQESNTVHADIVETANPACAA
ncbi:biotin synthase BioB [Arenimonas daejeonensis]|uniref:biotin synthase BioB n=1 Tax=Arenimonas daejeonensis TaxID=370777 RepID=UPI001D141BE9|nr:biotin synthase BioB [Arenimonas daejeonensis]